MSRATSAAPIAVFSGESVAEHTRRLAVLPDHVAEYGLETSPAKASDRRAFDGETVQAEALPPDVLAGIVRQAVESEIDLEVYAATLEDEREQRTRLTAWAERLESLEGG